MKEDIIKELKTVYDPEMPSVDVFNLGLIYDIDIKEDKKVTITHTLTSMLCLDSFSATSNAISTSDPDAINDILSLSAEGRNYSVYKIDSFERK